MGDSNQSQTTISKPWKQTIPGLRFLSNRVNDFLRNGSWQPTGDENAALRQLMANAKGLPNFGPQAGNIISKFLSGDPNNLLMPGYQAYKDSMTPLATQDLDPTKTPGMANLLSTIQNDIGNNVNGMFAGAGRDMSGSHMQALSRGMSQGMAQPLLGQYNQNVAHRMGASNGLLGAAGATSTAMGNNQTAGMGMIPSLPGITNMGANAMLSAAATERGLPLRNLAQLEALLLPIAGLGGQSHTQSTSSPSLMSQIGQGFGLAGTGFGLGGSLMGGMPMGGGASFNPFGGFTGNYFPGNPSAAGASYGQYGGQYFPMFG